MKRGSWKYLMVAQVEANDGSNKWNCVNNGNSIQSSTVNLFINTTGTPNVSAQYMPSSGYTLFYYKEIYTQFLIEKSHPLVNVINLLLDDFPASEFHVLSFPNTLSAPYSYSRVFRNVGTETSETRESPKRNNTIIYTTCMIKLHLLIKSILTSTCYIIRVKLLMTAYLCRVFLARQRKRRTALTPRTPCPFNKPHNCERSLYKENFIQIEY